MTDLEPVTIHEPVTELETNPRDLQPDLTIGGPLTGSPEEIHAWVLFYPNVQRVDFKWVGAEPPGRPNGLWSAKIWLKPNDSSQAPTTVLLGNSVSLEEAEDHAQ